MLAARKGGKGARTVPSTVRPHHQATSGNGRESPGRGGDGSGGKGARPAEDAGALQRDRSFPTAAAALLRREGVATTTLAQPERSVADALDRHRSVPRGNLPVLGTRRGREHCFAGGGRFPSVENLAAIESNTPSEKGVAFLEGNQEKRRWRAWLLSIFDDLVGRLRRSGSLYQPLSLFSGLVLSFSSTGAIRWGVGVLSSNMHMRH